ncbi:putative COPII-coated vesicle protein SurF4/Erv29 [Myxozyma melibiosi]|uniref:COPII-coated vesicle protein SurF4/Erv29 n=1 Tax=Myxozyma melibiosi TaxID=54550 RepID=A0ABR1FB35_9ASCO
MSIRGTASRQFHSMPISISSRAPPMASTADPSPLETLRRQTTRIEELLDSVSGPVKPYVPAIGRFLIVATFIEDAFRIMSQWSDQVFYLYSYRHIPRFIVIIFLFCNIVAMLAGSFCVITRKYTIYAVGALVGVVVSQAVGYGLIFELKFFLRNLSVIGGLLLVLSDTFSQRRMTFAGLPNMDQKDKQMYFLLAGRVLLIFLFLGFVVSGGWTLGRLFISAVGLVACVMVVVGFKTKLSAMFLVLLLSIFNICINHYWTYSSSHPNRDFLKYEYFQTLSIVGGLLLVVNAGAGKLSIDEKKKIY